MFGRLFSGPRIRMGLEYCCKEGNGVLAKNGVKEGFLLNKQEGLLQQSP